MLERRRSLLRDSYIINDLSSSYKQTREVKEETSHNLPFVSIGEVRRSFLKRRSPPFPG
jgi:hypothetical protein